MTDQKVLVFGSFTEDEIKFLHRQPPETALQRQPLDREIIFGSLDSETLRSLGIFNTTPSHVDYSKGRPLKFVNKENPLKVCTRETVTQIAASTVDEKGCIDDTCPASCRDGIEEMRTDNVELSVLHVSKNASDVLKHSRPGHYASQGVTLFSGLLGNEALVDSSLRAVVVNSEESVPKASNGLGVTVGNLNLLPRGLVNLGNLCFLNATLQALLSCPPFVSLLEELRTHDIPEIGYPTSRALVEFISNFDAPTNSNTEKKEIVLEMGRPLRPVMFESVLERFTPDMTNSIFSRPRQEDAQEFLSFVLLQMHDELLKLEGKIPSCNGGRAHLVSSIDDENADDMWETVGPKNRTTITRTQSFIPSKLSVIFGGRLRSVVKARGSKASATIEPFLWLHLNISPEPICSIEDALCLFSAPETVEGYRTSAAGKGEVVNASKSVKILDLSEIMILHLMRFSYGSQGSTKLLKPIRFPLELVLERDLLVSPSSESRSYELIATITHHGTEPSTGHYTADARHSDGKWLHYDDCSVTVIPASKVLSEPAYILFYKQL